MEKAIKYLKKQVKLMIKEQEEAWDRYEKTVIEDPDREEELMREDARLEGYLSAISDLEKEV